MNLRGQGGFSLIELMIVIAVIVVIMAIAIPSLLRSEIGANETSAIATLKALATAQHQFRLSRTVDQDGDGRGEYGFLQELAGDEVPRSCSAPLQSGAFISASLGVTTNGAAVRNGYVFLMYLPTSDNGTRREVDGAAPTRPTEADYQETAWTCYAWPERMDYSGSRIFVINETGQIMVSDNTGPRQGYKGTRTRPDDNAAYVTGTRGCIGELASPKDTASDGGTWMAAQ